MGGEDIAYLTTPVKTALLQSGWPDAIQLVEFVGKGNPEGFKKWCKNKSTLYLREICEPYRRSVYYRDTRRGEPLPFENDVDAMDAVIGRLRLK